jgi:hypothetical protein
VRLICAMLVAVLALVCSAASADARVLRSRGSCGASAASSCASAPRATVRERHVLVVRHREARPRLFGGRCR